MMINEIIQRLQKLDSLKVNQAIITDGYPDNPALSLISDEWSMGINCPWRLFSISENILLDGRRVKYWLEGRKITHIEPQSSRYPADFAFTFENGIILEIFSDDVYYEPWTMHVPGVVFVPSLGSPDLGFGECQK